MLNEDYRDMLHALSGEKVRFILGILLRIPSIDDHIVNKKATGRTKDLADAEALELLKAPNNGIE